MNKYYLSLIKNNNFFLKFEKFSFFGKDFLNKFLQFRKVDIINGNTGFARDENCYLFDSNINAENSKNIKKETAQYKAVLLKEKEFLTRVITIPSMSFADIERTVKLEVQMASPFEENKNLISYEISNKLRKSESDILSIYITSKDIIGKVFSRENISIKDENIPEVWIQARNDKIILLPGFGENKRLQSENRKKIIAILFFCTAIFSIAILLTMPTLQLRSQAIYANDKFQLLAKKAESAMHARQLLASELIILEELAQRANQVDHMHVISLLTQNLPDDTAVQSLSFNNDKLQIMGLSGNASVLIPSLSKLSGFKKVEMINAITRATNSNKEIFNLQIEIDKSSFDQVK